MHCCWMQVKMWPQCATGRSQAVPSNIGRRRTQSLHTEHQPQPAAVPRQQLTHFSCCSGPLQATGEEFYPLQWQEEGKKKSNFQYVTLRVSPALEVSVCWKRQCKNILLWEHPKMLMLQIQCCFRMLQEPCFSFFSFSSLNEEASDWS